MSFLVERVVVLRNGTTIFLPEFSAETEAEANGLVARMTGEETEVSASRLVLPSKDGLVDTGYSLAEYITEVLGFRDIGFRVTMVEAPPRIVLT